jgi:hypothetical protein
MELYVVSVAVLVGVGAVLGFVLRAWALLGPVGLVAVLAYGWEFQDEALVYAVIAGALATIGVAAGIALRARFGGRLTNP